MLFMPQPVLYVPAAAGGNFAGLTESSTGWWDDTAGTADGTVDQTSHAFDIGTAFSDRVCYAAVFNRFDEVITSVTIGGVSATVVGVTNTGAGGAWIDFWRAIVPTGTSATVVVDYDGGVAASAGGINMYYGRDCTEANITNNTTPADPFQASINPNAGSSILAGQMGNNNGSAAPTGIGVTLDIQADLDNNDYFSTGHVDSVSTGAANYGFDLGSAAANGALSVFEVRQL